MVAMCILKELYLVSGIVFDYIDRAAFLSGCSGGQFFCWAIVSEYAGDAGATNFIHNLWHLLLDGSSFCEEECHRN